jgi:hypothetical protein
MLCGIVLSVLFLVLLIPALRRPHAHDGRLPRDVIRMNLEM